MQCLQKLWSKILRGGSVFCLLLVICFSFAACGGHTVDGEQTQEQSPEQSPDTTVDQTTTPASTVKIDVLLQNTSDKLDATHYTLAALSKSNSQNNGGLKTQSLSMPEVYEAMKIDNTSNIKSCISGTSWMIESALHQYAIIEYVYNVIGESVIGVNYDVQQDFYDHKAPNGQNIHMPIYFRTDCDYQNYLLTMNYYAPNQMEDGSFDDATFCQTTLTFDQDNQPLQLNVNYIYRDSYFKYRNLTYDFVNDHIRSSNFRLWAENVALFDPVIVDKDAVTLDWLKENINNFEYFDIDLQDLLQTRRCSYWNSNKLNDSTALLMLNKYQNFDFIDMQQMQTDLQQNLVIYPLELGNRVCNYIEGNFRFVYDENAEQFVYIHTRDFEGNEIQNNIGLQGTALKVDGFTKVGDYTFYKRYAYINRNNVDFDFLTAVNNQVTCESNQDTQLYFCYCDQGLVTWRYHYHSYDLSVGQHQIWITVTTPDGAQQTYEIQIEIAAPQKVAMKFHANDGTGAYKILEVDESNPFENTENLFNKPGCYHYSWRLYVDVNGNYNAYADWYISFGMMIEQYMWCYSISINSLPYPLPDSTDWWIIECCQNLNVTLVGWYLDNTYTQPITQIPELELLEQIGTDAIYLYAKVEPIV